MTGRLVHGCGRSGALTAGAFRERRGRFELMLEDGVVCDFGAYGAMAERAVANLDERPVLMDDAWSIAEAISANNRDPSAVILEITQSCDVGCVTCIASSIPTRVGERPPRAIASDLSWLGRHQGGAETLPVFLSGGEPTQHPRFWTIVSDAAFAALPVRYVITSGIDFADPAFARSFAEQVPGTRLYLQYDSYDPAHIEAIRGVQLAEIRTKAIQNCEEFGIRYTLVCVVMKGVNDTAISEIIGRNIDRPSCEGITFQPIKLVGRNNFATKQHHLTSLEVASRIEDWTLDHWTKPMSVHPANPINWMITYERAEQDTHRMYDDVGQKRLAVIGHTDRENFVLESTSQYPVEFLAARKLTPLELHYKTLHLDIASAAA